MDDATNSKAENGADLRSRVRDLAHDLTNQFGVIRNFAELAAEDADAPHRLREDLAEIQEAARRGLELTSQLNALTEHDAGR